MLLYLVLFGINDSNKDKQWWGPQRVADMMMLAFVTQRIVACLQELRMKRSSFHIEDASCGRYQVDVIIPPFGIIQKKITLHPANQQPVLNICQWWSREKKSLEASCKRVPPSPHHMMLNPFKIHVCACVFMWPSLFLFACACNWQSDIKQRLLNCSCQKFSQDNPLLPVINAGLVRRLIYVSQSDLHVAEHEPIIAFCIACYWSSTGYATWCFWVLLVSSLLT